MVPLLASLLMESTCAHIVFADKFADLQIAFKSSPV